ncbi:acyltransferase family protein [Marinagarivorans cellulosilyticus]|uniref:Acyltransferase 3 domain-containing protein n=1 Tax=Marinagarivorans cellulosilyticus TaxID=2721545 RepID=A0AAN1WIT3_9GAMM|nr:acyltransferase [Marinagarivorans cellulosilyticus]BCD98330.1 hypothetical protein MARGE09_P2531 [Marinagarivorans cellulosilyticus]
MNHRLSLSLDFIRLAAALLVLLHHFSYERFTGNFLSFIRQLELGHDAVVIFFVLSGYVICHAVSRTNKGFLDYMSRRLARLYSVLLPAIFIVLFLDVLGTAVAHQVYDGKIANSHILMRGIINLLFLQEWQFFSIRFSSDGPLWSLGYEFWYYCIFGVFWFIDKPLYRYLLICTLAFFIGLKILLLMPIWWLGVVVYNQHKKQGSTLYSRRAVSLIGLVTPFIIYMMYKTSHLSQLSSDVSGFLLTYFFSDLNFNNSGLFINDIFVALLFAVSLYFLPAGLSHINFSVGRRVNAFIRKAAGATLTIYILHFPFLLFTYASLSQFSAVTPLWLDSVALVLVILCCYFISLFTEAKKQPYQIHIFAILDFAKCSLVRSANKRLR